MLILLPKVPDYYREVGQRVRAAREEAGMTQERLADLLGMSDSGLTLWESGKRRIPLDQLREIGRLTGKPMWWLMSGDAPDEATVIIDGVRYLTPEKRQEVISFMEFKNEEQRRERAG